MLSEKSLFYLIIIHSVIAPLQINLDRTDWVRNNESDVVFQHDCLYVAAPIEKKNDPREIISYCMGEWSPQWNGEESNLHQKLTFAELYRQHITSRQLYLWSAPVHIVEQYQFYLNQRTTSSETSLASELFYNCTLPRFGPLCQYELDDYESDHLSLNELIHDFYLYEYEPTSMTCYLHLQCNRGPAPACLDWSEICDGKVDCLDGGQDEEHCWQLEINECKENEYRCINGQCISNAFFRDDPDVPDCLDGSDEIVHPDDKLNKCDITEPTFGCEDVTCTMNRWWSSHTTPLTSSCVKQRSNLLMKAMFLGKPSSVSDECWLAFMCLLHVPQSWINQTCTHCQNGACDEIIRKTCPNMSYVPAVPILFGHVYFAYTKNNSHYSYFPIRPDYVCYNDQFCPAVNANESFLFSNNVTCARPRDRSVRFYVGKGSWISLFVTPAYNLFSTCSFTINNDSVLCSRSNMYQCKNSRKCISKHRLRDNVQDCYYADDEQLTIDNHNCSSELLVKHFKCKTTNECISHHLVGDGECHCTKYGDDFCDDEPSIARSIITEISFPTVCDGFIELFPLIIDGQQETDETNCEQWMCNNTYTRCDGFWNCPDGADEVDCDSLPLINCPLHHHLCVSPYTSQLMCLPIEKAGNGKVDCHGGTDEPQLCRAKNYTVSNKNFYCINDTGCTCIEPMTLCDFRPDCMYGDDEQVCDNNWNERWPESICLQEYVSIRSDVEKFLCERFIDTRKRQNVHFSMGEDTDWINHTREYQPSSELSFSSKTRSTRQRQRRCHRGLDLRVWLNSGSNLTTTTCLCPPAFYGNQCQYQNQRVSLTMQIRALSDAWRTPFAFIVSLIDDDGDKRTIHFSKQFTYLPMRDCQSKFNIYLLYSTQPKLWTKQYSIHIDIYEKIALTYRGSWLIPVTFPFLPVQRLAIQLNIPHSSARASVKNCSNQQCLHGRCVGYFDNSLVHPFCQCNRGWSGRYCTIPHVCTCSLDSLCIGFSADNRSICVCPVDKFGPRCLLDNLICRLDQNVTCLNGGQCIPDDEHMTFKRKFTCVCPTGFIGERCEIPGTKIILSFHKEIALSQSMLVHFIEVVRDAEPKNASTFKTIPIGQNSVTIHWSHPFHIAIIELFNRTYYLTVVQKTYNRSATIIKQINLSDRCENLSQILDETIVKLHLLRRIKYYHLPCRRRSPPLSCFYDDDHFCLCTNFGEQRMANCFRFDHNMKRDCFGQSGCENGGQCFQDNQICAQTSMCVCPVCFYGTRCQFSTNGYSLSLDTILGYHILPDITIRYQPHTLQISIVVNVLMTIAGLTNGILSIITFKNEKLRQVGCGIYLLGSSITTLFIMMILALKFWILVYAQMAVIINQSFLHVQCFSLDFLLRVCFNLEQWLNACVAIERAVTIKKGANFDQKKSRKMAKWTILSLLLLTVSTAIHDPIYRRLIDDVDGDQKRLWCTVTYPPLIRVFNLTVNIFHLLTPFLINVISAIIIITANAHQKATVRNEKTYRELLREQFQQHNRILVAPFVLVLLACPHLIISFASGCMKSPRQSWLFLTGYFVTYVPPMLTFIIFVLPSKSYKDEFRKSVERLRKAIQTRLHALLGR